MDTLEYILFPFYILAFFFLARYKLKNIPDPVLKIYYKRAFLIRVISCLAFSIFLVYISSGDSFGTYYAEAQNIYRQSLNDPTIIQRMIFTSSKNIDKTLFLKEAGGSAVFFDESNYMTVRLAAIFMFFSFGKYLITNLFFAMLAFEGSWRLYKFFYEQYPLLHKQFAFAILYFPTFVFWSSGISKEAVCIAGIGFITYGLYSIFIKKADFISNILLVSLFTYLLINVKIYILLSYLPFLIYYIVVTRVLKVKNKFVKVLVGPAIVILVMAGIVSIIVNSDDKLGLYAVDGLSESIQRQQSNFQLQESIAESNFDLGVQLDGSALGFIKAIPAAVTASLFRPFIWEINKLSTFLSSIESLILMLFTIYVVFKTGVFNFVRFIFQKPIIAYSFLFAIVFSAFVGITTLNFGSLVRYKIPCLPFYAVSLFLILHFSTLKKQESLKGKGVT